MRTLAGYIGTKTWVNAIMKQNNSVELLVDRYIWENTLTEGSYLPSDEDLAELLKCDVEAVSEALVTAEKKQKVKRQADGRMVVLSLPVLSDQDAFSFAESAKAHGEKLVTQVLEKEIRLPLQDEEHSLYHMEKRAHQALGLDDKAPFIVIARFRLLHNEPRAIHRAYLDPDRFPKNFLDHNFEEESLIHIYNQYGYELTSRDTTLTARFTNLSERALFSSYHKDVAGRPILDAEQKLFAIDPKNRKSIILEFLQASYLDWKYEIKNRPAP